MAKVLVSLDVWFDGMNGEPTDDEVKEFTKSMIETGAECGGSCGITIHSVQVIK